MVAANSSGLQYDYNYFTLVLIWLRTDSLTHTHAHTRTDTHTHTHTHTHWFTRGTQALTQEHTPAGTDVIIIKNKIV